MGITLDMVGIVVRDMGKSLDFYRTLGLDVSPPEDGGPYTETTLPNGLRLSFNDLEMIKEHDPEWVEPTGQRLGLAFLCEGPSDVDDRFARLTEAGYRGYKAPWDAFWGQRYAQVEDPDGNVIDLFAPLAN